MSYSRVEALYNGPCLDRRTRIKKVCARDYAGTKVFKSLSIRIYFLGRGATMQYLGRISVSGLVSITSC